MKSGNDGDFDFNKAICQKIIPVHGKEHRDVAINAKPMNTVKD